MKMKKRFVVQQNQDYMEDFNQMYAFEYELIKNTD